MHMNMYDGFENIKGVIHPCPVCGQTEFPFEGSFFICKVCGWEDDNIQYEDHDYTGGANKLSVNQYKKWWAQKQNNTDTAE